MLEAMRQLALDYLFKQLGNGPPPADLENWFHSLRQDHPEMLFPYLVEDPETVNEVYIIGPDSNDSEFATLLSKEMTADLAPYLPFIRPSGSQGAQVGPVIKRSYSRQQGAGPSEKIIKTTVDSFREIAQTHHAWAGYFQEICDVLERPKLRLPDHSEVRWKDAFSSMLHAAIVLIGEKRETVFLAIADLQGSLPGQRQEYLEYLMKEKLAGARYVTGATAAQEGAQCPLCGTDSVTVYPNAVKGAGINLGNVDREGAFPGMNLTNAWKGYALCGDCADLLYVYKYHVLNQDPVSKKRPFMAPVAGDPALIIPYSNATPRDRQELVVAVQDFIRNVPTDVEEDECTLLDLLKDQKAILNMTFLWANVGQVIEDVRGILTDVPPSRLTELSRFNEHARAWSHAIFPEVSIPQFRPTLSLGAIRHLFRRPGGKKAQNANESRRLFHLRRSIAAGVYRGESIPVAQFWDEVMTTARWYWLEAIETGNTYGLLNEGRGKRGPYVTAAGWIRYMAWWIYYFRRLEVMEMPDMTYEPKLAELQPYFGNESGIDSPQKAFAFLLGVLYGKLLSVQGARGVNVSANALTWLKRLTLTGSDLPQLYVKIREKLLAYETEKSPKVRSLIEEVGELGVRLGSKIELDDTTTCYYLLLGQSLSQKILKKEDNDHVKEEIHE
ncbi:MAG: CRISPR-associated protein [Nitrospirae bacterium]|nr:MAG: CRISPR-associated protein [Nitrospirota bacterium]